MLRKDSILLEDFFYEDIEPEEEGKTVKCPFCDFEYVHIEAVKINAGGEITIHTPGGIYHRRGEPAGRGARVEIVFWCENGHRWIRSFQFHKGITYIEDELIDEADGNFLDWKDLWRD